MKTTLALQNVQRFATRLKNLRAKRRRTKGANRRPRPALDGAARGEILKKTGGRCHICGGKIGRNEPWDADHVLAHANGGDNSSQNFLPAHKLCNNLRWFYGAEEFQWILKLGVWTRTRIELQDERLMPMLEEFLKYERRRISRHRSNLIDQSEVDRTTAQGDSASG
jgi:5-methylcytosine-specific restriction endonuclease McrA